MDKELAVLIGASAREARVALELTQEDTAERVGLSPEFYARIERGSALPSVTSLVRICATLGVPPDTLLGRGGEQTGTYRGSVTRLHTQLTSDPPDIRRLVRRLRRASPQTLRMILLMVREIYK